MPPRVNADSPDAQPAFAGQPGDAHKGRGGEGATHSTQPPAPEPGTMLHAVCQLIAALSPDDRAALASILGTEGPPPSN